MQITPLFGLWWRRSNEIQSLIPKTSGERSSQELIDLITALTPVIKKYYPTLNAKGLVDDVANTLKEVLSTPPPVNLQS